MLGAVSIFVAFSEIWKIVGHSHLILTRSLHGLFTSHFSVPVFIPKLRDLAPKNAMLSIGNGGSVGFIGFGE